jgi:hypothetical protein
MNADKHPRLARALAFVLERKTLKQAAVAAFKAAAVTVEGVGRIVRGKKK